jgi:hypothetical protein
MNRDEALEAKREKEAAARRRKQTQQMIETAVGALLITGALGGMVAIAYYGYEHCKVTKECGF